MYQRPLDRNLAEGAAGGISEATRQLLNHKLSCASSSRPAPQHHQQVQCLCAEAQSPADSSLRAMASASSKGGLLLVGLLVASFCVAGSAGRAVPAAATSKLVLDPTGLLNRLLHGLLGPVTVDLVLNLKQVTAGVPVVVTVLDEVDGAGVLNLVGGVVDAVDPVVVRLTDGVLRLVFDVVGMKKTAVLPLDALRPVLAAGTNVVTVVLCLVQTVVDGVDVVQIVNGVGEVVFSLTEGL